jgi:hypothetical protein
LVQRERTRRSDASAHRSADPRGTPRFVGPVEPSACHRRRTRNRDATPVGGGWDSSAWRSGRFVRALGGGPPASRFGRAGAGAGDLGPGRVTVVTPAVLDVGLEPLVSRRLQVSLATAGALPANVACSRTPASTIEPARG